METNRPDQPALPADDAVLAAFDALPHSAAVLDQRGVIVAVNRAWESLGWGGGRPTCLGLDYLSVCAATHGEDAECARRVADGIRRLLAGEQVLLELDYPSHWSRAARWFRMSAHRLTAPTRGLVVVHTDITATRSMEQALQASEARHRGVLEDQTELISRFTADGDFLYVNDAYCRFFGRRAEELLGRRWQPVAHPDDLAMIGRQLARLAPDNPVVSIENRVYGAEGGLRWMHFVNRGFFDAAGNLVEIQSVGRDITERVTAEERLRLLLEENTRLGRELIRLQEVERQHLAQELHDDLSQQLVAIRAYAGAIRRNAGDPARSEANAAAIESAVGEIYDASHRLVEGLHPQVLDSAGLSAAICLLLARWGTTHPETRAWLRLAGDVEPEDDLGRINLFRIVQECLANVHAHSGARRVRLFLGQRSRSDGRWLRLVVRDDGCGMDVAASHSGYGLIVMRERVRALGGSLRLQAGGRCGLRVVVDVPLGQKSG
ncbi:MAG: PAS domain S-box protein [Rhodocyclales bacterium]|nr:PAS domain S-box protein [Rhodocyclales bacterium]